VVGKVKKAKPIYSSQGLIKRKGDTYEDQNPMKTKEGRIANTKGLRWKPTYRVHRRKKREAKRGWRDQNREGREVKA
jgi:hypothetical protein